MAKKKTSSDEAPAKKAASKKKTATKKAAEEKTETPVKKKKAKKAEAEEATEPKKRGRKKVKDDDSPEGLTVETKETGIISFKEGSGSADLLALIAKHGFNREKVLEEAKEQRKAKTAFLKCKPESKYSKVAGIIKNLQNAGYKLPEVAGKKAKKAKTTKKTKKTESED